MGSPTGSSRRCVSCGREIAVDANVCQYCGHDYRVQAGPAKPHEKTMLSLVGGIMILVAGIVGLAMGGILVAIDIDDIGDYLPVDTAQGALDFIEDMITICGIIWIVVGLIAVMGGFFGVQRKHFGLVVLGGVMGLLCLGPYAIGSILALIGLILVLVSKKDFD